MVIQTEVAMKFSESFIVEGLCLGVCHIQFQVDLSNLPVCKEIIYIMNCIYPLLFDWNFVFKFVLIICANA
jgi:hypothetical protein